jgi:hypothetical protein
MVLQIAHQVERWLIGVRFGDETMGCRAFGSGWDASRKKFTWHPAARRIVCVSGESTYAVPRVRHTAGLMQVPDAPSVA